MPAILAGRVLVIPVRAAWMGPVPLVPSAQNLSQLGYLTVSMLLALALRGDPARAGGAPAGLRGALPRRLRWRWRPGSWTMRRLRLPLEAVLAPFRTASYALLVSDQALGGKRVVGLMPEASSFGLLCLGFSQPPLLPAARRSTATAACGFAGPSRAAGGLRLRCRPHRRPTSGWRCSGSSAAVDWVWRAAGLRRGAPGRRGLAGEAWVAGGALAAVMLVLVVFPRRSRAAGRGLRRHGAAEAGVVLLSRAQPWTATSWRALLASGGLGVGVGSTRASSSIVAVAAGTGLLGAALYLGVRGADAGAAGAARATPRARCCSAGCAGRCCRLSPST